MFDFENIPVHWINRLAIVTRKELVQRFRTAGHDITAEEWAILLLLWQTDGQYPGDMSERTFRDPTTMTRMIDGMVRKDLVHRKIDTSDRRKTKICLTATGIDLQVDLEDIAATMLSIVAKGIHKDDIVTTTRVLRQMIVNLSSPSE